MSEPLGLESGIVRVVPYDTRWPALYAAEAARVGALLERAGVQVALEHSGSTAVPGLAAKPIIDILATHGAESTRPAVIAALVAAGYEHRGEQGIPGRDFFRRGTPRSYHVHLCDAASDFARQHRAFRDHLRAHPEAASEYQALKLDLARRHPCDREAYTDGKTDLVLRLLQEAGD